MAEVHLQDGETLENALRRFKRKALQEDIIKEVKRRAFYLNRVRRSASSIKSALARKRNRKKRMRDNASEANR